MEGAQLDFFSQLVPQPTYESFSAEDIKARLRQLRQQAEKENPGTMTGASTGAGRVDLHHSGRLLPGAVTSVIIAPAT